MKISISKNNGFTIASIIVIVLTWEIAARLSGSGLILPSPGSTLKSFIHIIGSEDFFSSILFTIFRGIIGFGIALALGLIFGILCGLNESLNAFMRPPIVAIRSTPVISFILLALIWFEVDQVPVFIAVLTMFPIISINLMEGIRNVNPEIIEMSDTYKVSKARMVKELYIPAVLPFIMSGVSNAIGFGWRAIIIGEVLSNPQYGIGTMMHSAQAYLLVSELIAWTLIAIIISYFFELLLKFLEKKIIRWK